VKPPWHDTIRQPAADDGSISRARVLEKHDARFGTNDSVIFDLYNEPRPDDGADTARAWKCIPDGGKCAAVSFMVAGMQELVNDARADGGTKVLLVDSANSAEWLDRWLAYKPPYPRNDVAASIHMYKAGPCATASCWKSQIAQWPRGCQ
jgi:Cellulase (glycosyl hydrolase family 5)